MGPKPNPQAPSASSLGLHPLCGFVFTQLDEASRPDLVAFLKGGPPEDLAQCVAEAEKALAALAGSSVEPAAGWESAQQVCWALRELTRPGAPFTHLPPAFMGLLARVMNR